tara:strand:- start:1130 stop:1318 length:189 start_codon:yes stop_codon:yes gene_type:complete
MWREIIASTLDGIAAHAERAKRVHSRISTRSNLAISAKSTALTACGKLASTDEQCVSHTLFN